MEINLSFFYPTVWAGFSLHDNKGRRDNGQGKQAQMVLSRRTMVGEKGLRAGSTTVKVSSELAGPSALSSALSALLSSAGLPFLCQ